jgi:PAS domain-containing protein
MADTLEALFSEIAAKASSFDEPMLSHICKIAALEAKGKKVPFQISRQKFIGIWDWDVPNDRNHVDPGCAALFGLEPRDAAKGMPNSAFIAGIHPQDFIDVGRLLSHVLKDGGGFEASYRVIANNRERRVFARGLCTLDKSGRPERMPGAILELD